jgi:uncharacterized protein with HEPN domain
MFEREWRFYINDMLEFAENVLTYTEGFTQQKFVDTGLNYDATIRNLELIGEAATHIPAEIREMYTAIPWRQVIATRNKLIHNYLGIDDDTLWSIIQSDIPSLVEELERIINVQ